ncbi:SDR family oxidoreductase [Halieaceae bacterium IMCC14734]|uniref:SDR family oxidoreductase n=1 Tax=Candidatus Litorirhabdus singularis TaxID=2518993 RepID=A0ABT3THL2_9GAMM|nr:SDR family oxidoreductase [Candidatus Litorirhabdus singularis]MCX2980909.1 SDR family oxidoreductase [Candidatus Litorirhabdus singularis]
MFQRTRKLMSVLLLSIAATYTPATVSADDSEGTVLITGANRGIGLALAEVFSNAGYSVIGTARRPAAATALQALSVRVEQLDVTDPESVARLAGAVGKQPIDILINNAGMLSPEARDFSQLDIEGLLTEYQVNSLGPLRVTQALLPNVAASEGKIVANVSSMMGSMQLNTFGCCLGYRASKAALNSFTKTLAVDQGKTGVVFVVLHPGYVKTDINGGAGQISSEQSAAGLFKVITGLDESANGSFFNYDGKAMPW